MILKKVKTNLVTSVAAASIAIFGASAQAAISSGPYVGGQIGWGDIHLNDDDAPRGVKIDDTGLAGRVYGGYLINQYFGIEAGYTKFSNSSAKSSSTIAIGDDVVDFNTKVNVKTYAVDLVGKAILPLPHCFNVYGKLGVAYLHEKGTATISATDLDTGVTESISNGVSAHSYYPTFGLGVGYEVNQNIVADVAWNRIQKVGSNSSNSDLSSTDFIGVGLNYNFG